MTRLIDMTRALLAARLVALERALPAAPPRLERAPVFVLSLPRSGSTLFYLLLVQRFRVAYVSNLMAAFAASPVTIAKLARPLGGLDPPSQLDSHYGATRGWRAPNQGWRLWNRWLPEELDYIDPAQLAESTIDEMRATVHGLQRCIDAPFVNKWQRHVPRLRALAAAFPEALFVNLTRDPVMVAQSILAGRRQFLGDETAWLSARPRNYALIRDGDPVDQVCRQVVSLERDIDDDIASIGAERFMNASYEALCADPGRVLDSVADWYRNRTGQTLAIRQPLAVTLHAQAERKVSPEEFGRIETTLRALYATGDPSSIPAAIDGST
jgi:hypothetical protein